MGCDECDGIFTKLFYNDFYFSIGGFTKSAVNPSQRKRAKRTQLVECIRKYAVFNVNQTRHTL